MFGSNVLEVAIGMALVYLLLSLVAAAVRELVASVRRSRGRYLKQGVTELLYGYTDLADALYRHPQIYALYQGTSAPMSTAKGAPPAPSALPSYIPARNFAQALLDMTARGIDVRVATQAGAEANLLTVESVRRNIGTLGAPEVQRVILAALDSAQGDLARAQEALERWFDSAMDRISGQYRRETQWWLFGVGLATALWLDVDSIRIAETFYHDPAKRQVAVALAERVTAGDTPAASVAPSGDTTARAQIDASMSMIEAMRLPIRERAWTSWAEFGRAASRGWLGWLMTAFAISLGAPFWFDTLNKIMVIRSTVKPREKSPEEGSEDRKPHAPTRAAGATPAGELRVVVSSANAAASNPGIGARATGADAEYAPREWASGDPQGGVV